MPDADDVEGVGFACGCEELCTAASAGCSEAKERKDSCDDLGLGEFGTRREGSRSAIVGCCFRRNPVLSLGILEHGHRGAR